MTRCAACGASTSTTGASARSPPATIPLPCAARTSSPPRSSSTAALTVAPGRLGALARLGCGVYAAALAASGLQARAAAGDPADAVLVPAVLATMHGAHGVGELAGAAQYGPPWAALALAAGLRSAAERPALDATAVFAPSLHSS